MGVLTDAISNGQLDPLPPSERMKFILLVQHRDPDWMKLDPSKRAMVMQNALGIDTSTMQNAIHRRADILLEKQAGGLDDQGYLQRVGRIASEGAQEFNKALLSPSPSAGMGAIGGALKTVTSPAQAGLEEYYSKIGAPALGIGGTSEGEEYARGAADLVTKAGQQLGAIGKYEPGVIKPTGGTPTVMQHPERPLELLEENEPAQEATQARVVDDKTARGVDVTNPKAVVDQHIQQRTGVPVDAQVTVGQTPISTSVLGDDGTPHVDLADPSVESAVHESDHMAADITGGPQPPEDNEAIMGAATSDEPVPWGEGPEKAALGGPQPPTLVDMGESESAGSPAADNMAAQTRPDETTIDPNRVEPGPNAGQPSPNPYNGPKEQPQGQIPESLDYESSQRIGNEKKFKPMADTPPVKTPQEAKDRQGFFDLATRLFQSSVASLSGPRIFLSAHLRLMGEAVTQAFSRGMTGGENPWEGLKALTRIYNRPAVQGAIDAMMKGVGTEAGEEFMAGGSFDPTKNPLANKLGWVNKMAHMLPKTAAMSSRLETSLMQRGLTLADAAKATPEELADAMAYGNSVGLTSAPQSRIAKQILGVFQTPVGRMFSLFPRLTANTMMVANRWNPLLIRNIVSPEIWQAVAGRTGDPAAVKAMEEVSRATLSWAAIYGGYKMQESDPNFMQVNIGGHEISLSHAVPGVGQMAMLGATVQRMKHMTPGAEQSQFRDIAADMTKGLVGIPGPAGQAATDVISGTATGAGAKREAARTIGGFTQPLEVVKDIMGLFDAESAKARDGAGGWFDPALSHIPFAANTLPAQYRPDRPGERPNVSDERLYGVPIRETPTDAQNEMARLGVHASWYPYGGDEPKNLEYRKQAGGLNQTKIDALMANPEYQKAPDVIKRQLLEKMVGGTRRDLTKDKVSDTQQAIRDSQVK